MINGYREGGDPDPGPGPGPQPETHTATLTIDTSSFASRSVYGTIDNWAVGDFNGKADPSSSNTYLNFSNSSSCLVGPYSESKLGFIRKVEINMNSSYSKTNGTMDLYLGNSVRYNNGLIGEKYATISISESEYKYGSITIPVDDNYTFFAFSKPNVAAFNVDSFIITYDTDEYNATKWASSFIDETGQVCQNDGSTVFSSLSNKWTALETSYGLLNSEEAKCLNGQTAVIDNDNATTINSAIARYRMICGKYNKSSIQLNEFISGINISHSNKLSVSTSWNTEIILLFTISATVVSLAIVLCLRKRKHNV